MTTWNPPNSEKGWNQHHWRKFLNLVTCVAPAADILFWCLFCFCKLCLKESRILYHSIIHWLSRCTNAVLNVVSFSSHFIGIIAPIAPACRYSCFQSCGIMYLVVRQWMLSFRGYEDLNFYFCPTVTWWQHLEQNPCGKGTKLRPKYSWLRRSVHWKENPMTSVADHTLPLRSISTLTYADTLQSLLIPKCACLLWWRAGTPGREMCYCKWNLFIRSLLSLLGRCAQVQQWVAV